MRASRLSALWWLAACAHSPTPPPPPPPVVATVSAPNPCAELDASAPALPGAVVPAGYPFRRKPPLDPWATGGNLCERLGPSCTAVVIGADGLVDRVDFVFKPEPGRTPASASRRMLELVRSLKVELGLTEVPATWPARPDGGLRFGVSGRDGVGVIVGILETRPEFGVDWRGSLARRAVTGVSLGEARVLTRDEALRRLLGRHYCRQEGTNEFEVRRLCTPCDPVAGFAESCANVCRDSRVEKTRLVTRQVSEAHPARARLLRLHTASGDERLTWAVSMPGTPDNTPPDVYVDAFSGEVPPRELLDVRASSLVELDEEPQPHTVSPQ